MFVLDTDVLSLTSPVTRLDPARIDAWRDWVRDNRPGIHLSAVTIMEVRFGIENLKAKGSDAKAEALRRWLLAAETVHARRIIPVDAAIAHLAGTLLHRAVRNGGRPSSEDAIIAASAVSLGFRLISRNTKHMKLFEVASFDPFADPPAI